MCLGTPCLPTTFFFPSPCACLQDLPSNPQLPIVGTLPACPDMAAVVLVPSPVPPACPCPGTPLCLPSLLSQYPQLCGIAPCPSPSTPCYCLLPLLLFLMPCQPYAMDLTPPPFQILPCITNMGMHGTDREHSYILFYSPLPVCFPKLKTPCLAMDNLGTSMPVLPHSLTTLDPTQHLTYLAFLPLTVCLILCLALPSFLPCAPFCQTCLPCP